jgi:inorganic triphosphatase YgiF
MPLEIELKFPVDGFSALRRSLTEAGAVPDPVVFEQNIVYDMPPEAALPGAPGPLRAAGVLLRLRRNVAKGREPGPGCLR